MAKETIEFLEFDKYVEKGTAYIKISYQTDQMDETETIEVNEAFFNDLLFDHDFVDPMDLTEYDDEGSYPVLPFDYFEANFDFFGKIEFFETVKNRLLQ